MSTQRNATGEDAGRVDVVTRDLDSTSDREIRGLVRELTAGYEGVLADDAVLVADELVTNAHRHGAPPRVCRILLDPGRLLRVEVDDTARDQPRGRTPDATGGRGLVLVENLASAWGVRTHADHKTVWAEFALDHPTNDAPHLTGVDRP
ncbi:ATP-binding protein [Actinosynnema sp. NPDC020468]|uniref:ATP-binding protein n=1 Tax=Actinosynnema sp. NPDC020468 TaxID=3154488 RepID=UPI0033F210EF